MKRMWLTTTLVMCGLVQAAVGWNTASADDKAKGAELLPKDTLIFLTVPSVREAKEQFEKSLSGALLNDKELKPFLDDVTAKIGEFSEQWRDDIGVSISELLALPQGEITFALLHASERKLAPLLLMDYGDGNDTVEKLLKKMHDALDGDLAEHSIEEVDDIKIHVYTFKNHQQGNPFKTLAYFNNEKSLVFSTEVTALKKVIERWDGKNDDTLANNAVFKYIQDQCHDDSGEPSVVWFLNPIGLIQAGVNIVQTLSPQSGAGMALVVIPILGIDKLKGFGGASFGGSGDFDAVSKSFLYAEQPTGVLNVFLFPATELTPPKWVSADVGAYMGLNWNFAKAYQTVEGLMDTYLGRGELAKRMDQIANSDNWFGIHPKKDIIDSLDGRFHIIQRLDTQDDTSITQQVLIALEVKDEAKVKKILSKVAKSEDSPLETREFNGETIYEVGEDSLCFAVTSGQLVITNDVPALEGMLRTERQPSLVDSPAYRNVAKHFPAKTSMVAYQRSDAQLEAVYDMLKNADTQFIDGIDFKKLPSFEVIKKYLRPSGFYLVPDKKGVLSVSFQLSEGDR